MSNEYELDTSWENEYIRTTEGEVTYSPEPMSNIRVKFLYINADNQVQHSVSKICPLTIVNNDVGSELSETELMQLIYSNREFQNKRYKCDGISQYCLNIDPSKLFKHVHETDYSIDSKPYFTSFDIPRTMRFAPSLFIFHSLNSIWITFRELILVEPPKLVSIIKKVVLNRPKKTKRVRISTDLPTMSKTRKRL